MIHLLERVKKSMVPLVSLMIFGMIISVGCGSSDDDWMETPGSKTGGHLKVGMLADYNTFAPPLLLGMPDIYSVQHLSLIHI